MEETEAQARGEQRGDSLHEKAHKRRATAADSRDEQRAGQQMLRRAEVHQDQPEGYKTVRLRKKGTCSTRWQGHHSQSSQDTRDITQEPLSQR